MDQTQIIYTVLDKEMQEKETDVKLYTEAKTYLID